MDVTFRVEQTFSAHHQLAETVTDAGRTDAVAR
eukprot:COSAG06_NODE_19880_length_819_cov_0.538889_2_plen_32_part_01